MQDINGILKKLNVIERNKLNGYIKLETTKKENIMKEALMDSAKEREEAILKENEHVWTRITQSLRLALRENRVSEERIEKIYTRIFEIIKQNPKSKLFNLPEQPSKDFEILTKDEFRNLIEELLECNCKGCIKENKKCDVYQLLKRHDIPYPEGYIRKCRYGY